MMDNIDLVLTDYFMSRVYEIDGMCKFSISYNLSTDKSYYEVLEAPSGNVDVSQYVNAVPDLIDEKWIYMFNANEYMLVDRFEKDIISQATLFSKDGEIIIDELLLKKAADVALETTSKELAKINAFVDNALNGADVQAD